MAVHDMSAVTTAEPSGGPAEAGVRPLLAVNNVDVVYGVSLAVRGVSFTVPENGVVALLGPNGAGKTSIIRAVSGLLSMHNGSVRAGDILLDGTSIRGLAPDKIVARGVGQVPEGRLVFRQLTVEENLRAGTSARKVGNMGDALEGIYGLFPVLADRRKQKAGWLSGGEQQMVAVGRALMSQPRLLLLDEVSLGLAPRVVELIFQRLGEVRRNLRTAMLLVEQNAAIALEFADYGYILESGRVALEGTAAELTDNPAVQETYLGAGREGHSYRAQKHYRRRRRWVL
jgi:branched-chain amino acid transport system ATP-binding protein